ncbi:hypothetical protein T8K17_13405 [Thalassobaculum sp. OXR-137]|uniref:hypothetical protein n=1 Tax=Thalassobaculum sp. OXR-137 TaxID=3100173 RepID=UPI002AC8D863|nr:hypothetical protein [Thalassobaculum sp. OXR-137]WPZ32239.1 hypothetical protein T8K17_13405 [Thalassobaculum sp. OXR-137]
MAPGIIRVMPQVQASLFPDIIPESAIVPLDDARIGRRVHGRGGFRSLPRFVDVMACATKLGEAFTSDTVDGALIKNYRAASIDFAETEADVARILWGNRDVAALGEGCATDATGAVRKAVKRVRAAIKRAQDAGELLPTGVKVTESSQTRRAVVLVQSVLVRIPDQKRALLQIAEDAVCGVCDPDAIRVVLPALIRPDEWEAAVQIFGQVDALRWAMIESDKRLTAAIKRATRKVTEPTPAQDVDETPVPHTGKLGRKARLKARRKNRT